MHNMYTINILVLKNRPVNIYKIIMIEIKPKTNKGKLVDWLEIYLPMECNIHFKHALEALY